MLEDFSAVVAFEESEDHGTGDGIGKYIMPSLQGELVFYFWI